MWAEAVETYPKLYTGAFAQGLLAFFSTTVQ